MTQSNEDTFTINLDDINLTNTSDTITVSTDTYTLHTDGMGCTDHIYTTDSVDISSLSWDFGNKIDPNRVERMCKHYPALKKAWENFEAIYKMVDQDYKGNYEVDDDLPF